VIALLLLLAALPIREFPAKKPGDTFAIILTGDGGWRRIDDKLTRDLHEHGATAYPEFAAAAAIRSAVEPVGAMAMTGATLGNPLVNS